jgi:DNA-binding transcriptional ArsR family regulator
LTHNHSVVILCPKFPVENKVMPAARSVYEAISHPVRRRILDRLSKGSAPVHEIVRQFDMTQQGVSKHLRILSEAGLTRSRREGQENIYFLNAAPLNDVREWLETFWRGKLDRLKAIAEEDL